jgi:hypothetical protein
VLAHTVSEVGRDPGVDLPSAVTEVDVPHDKRVGSAASARMRQRRIFDLEPSG